MHPCADFIAVLIQVPRFLFSRTRLPAQHVSQDRVNTIVLSPRYIVSNLRASTLHLPSWISDGSARTNKDQINKKGFNQIMIKVYFRFYSPFKLVGAHVFDLNFLASAYLTPKSGLAVCPNISLIEPQRRAPTRRE